MDAPRGYLGHRGRTPLRSERVREFNRLLVMTVLRESGPRSRGKLAHATGLSHSSVAGIVAELQDRGIVDEVGVGDSAGGRRPVIVRVSDTGPLFVGLHLSPGQVHGLLAGADGSVIARSTLTCNPQLGPRHVIQTMLRTYEHLADEVPPGSIVHGFGVSVSGPMGPDGKFDPPDMPGWADEPPLLERLHSDIGLPGAIDNDANLGALAELYFGGAGGTENLIYVLVHQGVGAGVIIEGAVYGGSANRAGELGHVIVDPNGARCECGNHGCLETFVSTVKVVDYAVEGIRRGRPTNLAADDPTLDATKVIAAALDGDVAAARALEEAGEWLGIGLADVVNLFNPELVVLGGPLAAAGNHLLEAAESIARHKLQPALRDSVRFTTSSLGEDGPALGACGLACDHFVTAPTDRGMKSADDLEGSNR